ncbi:hypothetical protein ACFYOT_29140 [Saccharothrix saharensis]|uniref:hypothetical protein n=1 Tax=Saccharothrix saharensis TaxID=571190 RepID=UPI0036CAABB6
MDRELTDVEKLVADTFAAHEHVVPDGDAVLAAARARIDRGRAVLSRPFAVAAGVVALTLVAVTVVALHRPGSSDPAHDTAHDAAATSGDVRVTANPPEPTVADLPMPFSLGWLPPGRVEHVARRINTGAAANAPDEPLYGGEHMLTVTTGDQVLLVDVQQFRMTEVDEAAFKSGRGNPVTVNGRPGVENSSPDSGYELYVSHPEGGSVYVHVSDRPGGTVPAPQLADIGRRIAQHLRFPGTATVTPAFGLRDLPPGLRMCAFAVEGASPSRAGSTSYSLGTCTTTVPPVVVTTAATDVPTGVTGEPVQGRATRHAEENGYRRLWVLDAVAGTPVRIAGRVPLTDLYDIAHRLVLPR